MTDLAASVAALLHDAAEREPHAENCTAHPRYASAAFEACTCDRGARLEARTARAIVAAIEAAGRHGHGSLFASSTVRDACEGDALAALARGLTEGAA